ncbi:MAG: hypothetical protein HY325_01200 [Chloroflexi bacterium]|nr:hypothetical protein [Chloroflexota bacterium]
MTGRESTISLEVYDPTGAIEADEHHAPRLADLKGKTICELSDRVWEDYRTFPVLRELLQKRFPDAKIIPYTEFPNVYGINADVLFKALKEKGCDAVIVGNAA